MSSSAGSAGSAAAPAAGTPEATTGAAGGGPTPVLAALAWLWVLVPFGYGLVQLVAKIPALFGS